MYSLMTAFARAKAKPNPWEPQDFTTATIAQVAENFGRAWLQLKHTILPGDFLLDFNYLIQTTTNPNQTISEYLVENGAMSLPTVNGVGTIKTRRSHYHDLYRSDLTIGALSADTGTQEPKFEDNYYLTFAHKVLTPQTIAESYLVSINGYLHRTDYDTDVMYVEDSVGSGLISGERSVGLHHVGSIGKLKIVPITKAMVDQRPDQALYDFTTIRLPDVDLDKYTIGMSLGGYLHLGSPKTVHRFGKDRLCVRWRSIPLVQRIMDSRLRLRLDSLELTKALDNDQLIDLEDLKSDRVLLNYLTLSQSFLILIENTDVSVRTTPAVSGPIYNQYLSPVPQNLSLISERGQFLEYWGVEEMGSYSYLVPNPTVFNWRYERMNKAEVKFATDGHVVAKPGYARRKPAAFFFEIYSTQMVTTFEDTDTVLS